MIAGGGTAGCVLAARLSEDPDVTVCLIEAGPSDVGDDNILVLSEWMHLLDSGYDWDYPVEPQERGNSFMRHAGARCSAAARPTIRASRSIRPPNALDEWVAMGAAGWGAAEVLPLVRRLSRDGAAARRTARGSLRHSRSRGRGTGRHADGRVQPR